MKYYHIKGKDSLLINSSESFLFPAECHIDEGMAEDIFNNKILFPEPEEYLDEAVSHSLLSAEASAKVDGGGGQAAFVADRFVTKEFGKYICGDHDVEFVEFSGDINPAEFNRIKRTVKNAGIIISAGGGRCIDLCKLIKKEFPDITLIAVPTSAATCAAYTAVSVMYDKDGVYMDTIDSMPPDKIIIDYDILYKLPKAFFAAGLVDTLAKYYETFYHRNMTDDKCIYDDVLFSVASEVYSKIKKIIEKWENIKKSDIREITDINIIFSGMISNIGRYCITSSIAHAFSYALTASKAARTFMHGEHVGMGLLVQEATIDGNPLEEEVRNILRTLDIPVRIEGFGVTESETSKVFTMYDRLVAKEKITVPKDNNLMYNIFGRFY